MDKKVLMAHVPLPTAQNIDDMAARVREEEEHHCLTLKGMANVTAGRVVDQADVEAWAASLATGMPLPVPQR